jgi:hypothetical protein
MEGYGIYFNTLEIIARKMEDKVEEFGFIPEEWDDESLELEFKKNTNTIRTIFDYMCEIGLFEKIDGRIYNAKIQSRCDDYTSRILRNKAQNEKCPNTVRTKSDKVSLDKNRIDKNIYSKSNDLHHTQLEELVYEPLIGNKTKGAFLDRARAKKGKPPMLKKDPATWAVINLYRKQYKYIRGHYPVVGDADYFHVLSVTKKLSPQDMEKIVIWYVREENNKFKQHPSLKSIFTVENINIFNSQK